MFNEIDGDFDDVAIRTFKVGLPAEHDLRKPLTKKLVRSMCRLMDHIEEYKRLEDNQLHNKGKAPAISHPQQGGFQSRPRKDLRIQEPRPQMGEVNVAFKEPVHRIVD